MYKALGYGLIVSGILSGCGMSKQQWKAIGDASCAMSMNCKSTPRSQPPQTPQAGLLNGLSGWYRNKGNTMCVYKDGTVVNIGVGVCPLSN